MEKRFYGDKEILDIKPHPKHDTYKVLVFKDGTEEALTDKMIAVSVTSEATDLTELRNKRCFPVVEQILKAFLEWDIHIKDIDFIFLRATMSMNESLKKANTIKWGADENQQTMLMVHDVLMTPPRETGVKSPLSSEELGRTS